jgi:hypothetical protein
LVLNILTDMGAPPRNHRSRHHTQPVPMAAEDTTAPMVTGVDVSVVAEIEDHVPQKLLASIGSPADAHCSILPDEDWVREPTGCFFFFFL